MSGTAAKEEVIEIDCKDLVPRSDNRMLDRSLVSDIADSLERTGQAAPMIVRGLMGGKYELVDGHHRLAAKQLAAKRYPGNLAHRKASCIVRNLTDAEAEIVMLVANIQKPISIADRGRLFERIGIQIDELRDLNPDAYRGMDRGRAIAACASENGAPVSKATVYRSINEAHAEDGTHEYAGMTKGQRKAVSRMRTQQRKAAAKVLSDKGSVALDSWIDDVTSDEDQTALNTCLRRIRSAASEIRRLEKRGTRLDPCIADVLIAIEKGFDPAR